MRFIHNRHTPIAYTLSTGEWNLFFFASTFLTVQNSLTNSVFVNLPVCLSVDLINAMLPVRCAFAFISLFCTRKTCAQFLPFKLNNTSPRRIRLPGFERTWAPNHLPLNLPILASTERTYHSISTPFTQNTVNAHCLQFLTRRW